MAKKAKRTVGRIKVPRALQQQVDGVGQKIEEFADDLGRLLGLARDKADGWMGQRHTVSAHLAEIRDTATELLARISGGEAGTSTSRGVSTRRGATRRRSARPRQAAASAGSPTLAATPKKRTMSPEARRAVSEAQKARWARQRRTGKAGR